MGVKLEVFRMTLYLTFPVAMFWIANQAKWFEDVIQRKRELWPPEKEDQRQELEEFKARIRKQQEEKLLRTAQQSSGNPQVPVKQHTLSSFSWKK